MCVLAALQVELSELGCGGRQFFACLLSRSDFFLAKNDFKDIKSFTFLPRTFTVSEGVIFTADLQGFSSIVDSCLFSDWPGLIYVWNPLLDGWMTKKKGT